MTDWNIRHKLDPAGNADVIDSGVHETQASCDGLVGRDARHGDGVSRDAIRKPCAEGSLSGNVGRFDLLNDRSAADVVDQVLVESGSLHQTDKCHSLEIVRHQTFVARRGEQESGQRLNITRTEEPIKLSYTFS